MYAPIEMPSEGDGMTYVLMGNGYFRGDRLANLGYRLMAALVDTAVVLAAWAVALGLLWLYYEILSWTGLIETPIAVLVGLVLSLLPCAVLVANCVVMQARSGQSFGKMVFGLVLVSPRLDPTNVANTFLARPSVLLLLTRTALHALDLFLCLGLVSILMSNRYETIADRVCNTLVLRPTDLDNLPVHANAIGARDR